MLRTRLHCGRRRTIVQCAVVPAEICEPRSLLAAAYLIAPEYAKDISPEQIATPGQLLTSPLGDLRYEASGHLTHAQTGQIVVLSQVALPFSAGSLPADGLMSQEAQPVFLPFGASVDGKSTTELTFRGNLDSRAIPATHERLSAGTFWYAVTAFDRDCRPFELRFRFEKMDGQRWSMSTAMNAASGTVVADVGGAVAFDPDGSFSHIETNDGSAEIVLQLAEQTEFQRIRLTFRSPPVLGNSRIEDWTDI